MIMSQLWQQQHINIDKSMKTIERITESIRSIFEEQDNQGHEDEKIWPFILWIFLWMFISAVIGVFGCALLFKGCLDNELPCVFVVAAILFKPMVRLSIRKDKKNKD